MQLANDPYVILVVDDTPSNLQVVADILDEDEYTVSFATSGEQALEQAARCTPDLILLDIMMPGIGGFETCRRLKENHQTRDVPVIFMTAIAEISSKVQGFSLGAIDYITKPFHEEEVVARVKTHLALRKTQHQLQESEKQLSMILSSLTEGVWSATLEPFELLYINSAVEEIYGESSTSLLHSSYSWFDKIHPEDRQRVKNCFLQNPCLSKIKLEYRIIHHDASIRWVCCKAKVSFDESTHTHRLDGIIQDISERKAAECQLLHVAQHDGLTNLANRSYFIEQLEEYIQLPNQQESERYGILFVDLDRFKSINDSLGHDIGDKLLIRVAEVLLASVRPSDIVARLGGDEFTVLLRNVVDNEDVIRICDRIQRKLKMPMELEGQRVFITASIGVVMNSQTYQKAEEMLRDADIAMYQAKHLGKACHQIFSPEMYQRELNKITLEKELTAALENGELSLSYQPIKNLDTNTLQGFEALVRWFHPHRGKIFPSEFIPLAEESGLIIPLGKQVLQTACHQMKQWQLLCPQAQDLFVSINVSAHQLRNADFLATLDQILTETGLPPSSLFIEITESLLLENSDLNLNLFQAIRKRGIRLSLDDFGTGYSSLSYLHKFPIDTLKIDRSFVQAMKPGVNGFEIIRTITALARALQINVVAEGVETAEQVQYLKLLSCAKAQGFYFSQPLSTENATELILNEFGSAVLSASAASL